MAKKITKKEFKERCHFSEYGDGRRKRNAIFFDRTEDGYKYMVKTTVQNAKKNELFNILYDWVVNEIIPDWWVEYKYAHTDNDRFKVPLMG